MLPALSNIQYWVKSPKYTESYFYVYVAHYNYILVILYECLLTWVLWLERLATVLKVQH